MKYLVTGGNGFIGTNLIKRLLTDGHEVVSLDNLSTGSVDNEQVGVTYLYGSVEKIYHVLYPHKFVFDGIFHLGAASRVQPSFENPNETFKYNVSGTEAVCEFAREFKIPKIVYAGSSSKWHNPSDSPYAMYKYIGEEVCKLYKQTFGMDVEIARFYNVYGQGEIVDSKWGSVIGIWRDQLNQGHPITIVGDGEQRRDFTHVDDIVDGLCKIMSSDIKHEDAWELGTGVNYSVNELADIFMDRFTCGKIYIPEQKGNYRMTLRENLDAVERLGWEPKDRLEEYIHSL
jgi:UDP-glucose 4-epimerase